MAQRSPIECFDSSCSPISGCGGCELYPNPEKIRREVLRAVKEGTGVDPGLAALSLTRDFTTADFLKQKKRIATAVEELISSAPSGRSLAQLVSDAIDSQITCWAGRLAVRNLHGEGDFSLVHQRPHAMLESALWPDLRGKGQECSERKAKPWIWDYPRVIFIANRGDLLTREVPLEFVVEKVLRVADTPHGRRHLYVMLTKQSGRLVELSNFLRERGRRWPDNVMPMVSVTGRENVTRVSELAKVNCRLKGVMLEPWRTDLDLPLENLDWIVFGGESGVRPHGFELRWAERLIGRCAAAGVPCFAKQVGERPELDGGVFKPGGDLGHNGSNWFEWPQWLRIRQMPPQFLQVARKFNLPK